jgi:hypothetical protein
MGCGVEVPRDGTAERLTAVNDDGHAAREFVDVLDARHAWLQNAALRAEAIDLAALADQLELEC